MFKKNMDSLLFCAAAERFFLFGPTQLPQQSEERKKQMVQLGEMGGREQLTMGYEIWGSMRH